jgi:hypothetical protein
MAAKSTGERIAIKSEKDIKKHAVSILRRINEDERGGLLFLLNPVLALEEAGFDLNEEMRRHILHGLRYGAKAKARIRDREEAMAEIAGRKIDALSDEAVGRLLFVELKIPLPGQEAANVQAKGKETGKEAHLPPITDEILEAVRAKHKIVPILIELRQLLKSGWRFVDPETYEKVKSGATVTLLRRVRFHKQSKK